MKQFFIVIILSLIVSSCMSYHIQEKDVFNPKKVSKLNSDIQLEDVFFYTSDSLQLNGWFVKHNDAKGTLLYFGGNGFYLWNRSTPDAINLLSSLKLNLLIIDYRGYGRSEGTPGINGIYEDGLSAYKYLCSRGDLDSTKIILYGHSLGTFVAVHLGSIYPAAGVILEGAISNTSEMKDAALKNAVPWYLRWLVKVSADSIVLSLDNVSRAKHLKQPLLVVTGEKDNIAPPEMGLKIINAANSSMKIFEIIPKGEHNDLYFSNEDGRRDFYIKTLSKYLNEILTTDKNASAR